MNWYKITQVQLLEIWRIPKDEYVAFDSDYYNSLPEEEQTLYFNEKSKKRDKWMEAMRYAVTMGQISPQESEQLGFWGGSAANVTNLKPLPKILYHVTTARDAVIQDKLKTRKELSQFSGLGLGGGTSEAISFTTNLDIAKGIYNGIKEGRRAAKGELSIRDMVDQALKGANAQRPWLKDVTDYLHYTWKPGEPVPSSLFVTDKDYKVINTFLPHSIEDINEGRATLLNWDKKFLGQIKAIPSSRFGTGNKFNKFIRPYPEEEKIEDRFDFFKKWAFFREGAGGPLDPLFFTSDPIGLSKIPEDQIAILEFRAKLGSYGYPMSALGEWRAWTGDAVELVREINL